MEFIYNPSVIFPSNALHIFPNYIGSKVIFRKSASYVYYIIICTTEIAYFLIAFKHSFPFSPRITVFH